MIYPWQKKQWQEIIARYAQGRLPHALLLAGSRGLGKVDFAKTLAALILCEKKGESACGICRDCRLFQAGNHPDFLKVTLEEKSKTIKVAQIRALINSLNQTSQRGHFQVVIIHPAEAMNRAAANAFLKTLEEPLGQVFLILVSHQPGALLPTISSRCQRLTFTSRTDEVIIQWLQKQIGGDKNKIMQLLALANQAPLQALKLESLNYLTLRDRLIKDVVATVAQQGYAIGVASALLKEDLLLILQVLITLLMDVWRLQLKATDFIVNVDQLESLQKLNAALSKEKIITLLEQLQEAWRLVEKAVPVNIQLLLEGIFLALEMNHVG